MRAVTLLAGPLLWLAGLVVVAIVVHRGSAVGVALLILAASFLLSLAFLVPAHRRALRESKEPPP
jgi:hypothetical protein